MGLYLGKRDAYTPTPDAANAHTLLWRVTQSPKTLHKLSGLLLRSSRSRAANQTQLHTQAQRGY
jgi:hypothetical protein